MKLFYGWVIVGVGIVMTCIGMGTMMSLGVFLQPMSQDMGWSRAGISFAAVLNFLAMGFGSFFWGSLSDRFGTRAVVLAGGVLLGIGLIAASQAATLLAVPAAVRHHGRAGGGQLLCADDATVTRWFTRQPQPRRGTRLGRHGLRLGADRADCRAGSSATTTGAPPCW